MLAIWTKIKGWLIVAALFVGGVFVAFYRGRREGKVEAKQEQTADAFKEHVEAEKKIHEATKKVDSMSDTDVDDHLDPWMRD